MPGLTREFLEELLSAAEASGSTTIPIGPSGRMEPLCAVWRGNALGALEAAFGRGIRKVAAALEGVRWTGYAVAEVATFQNVNTPEEWAGHAAK
jgi:molybdopterin-guanine dinucleotide biosynthesis protein A